MKITMTPEERFNHEVLWVLQQLKYLWLSAKRGAAIEFVIKVRPEREQGVPSVEAQRNALLKIEELRGIKIIGTDTREFWYGKDFAFFVKVLEEKFKNVYGLFEKVLIDEPRDDAAQSSEAPEAKKGDNLSPAQKGQIAAIEKALDEGLKEERIANRVLERINQPSDNLPTADKKHCVLEKLKDEEALTPKIPVRRHIHFGYSYVRPAGEASLGEQKITKWIQNCGLSDLFELENILTIFMQEGLISASNFSQQTGLLTIQFPNDFEKRYSEYKSRFSDTREKPPEVPDKRLPAKSTRLFANELKPESQIGPLASYSDGTIRYNETILEMRNQLKDLCRIFLAHGKRLVTSDDIRDKIIHADKRKTTPNSTIAKYISELHGILKTHFKKEVIFSQTGEGWHFDHKK